jgi:hypothetical protein
MMKTGRNPSTASALAMDDRHPRAVPHATLSLSLSELWLPAPAAAVSVHDLIELAIEGVAP